MKTRMSVNVLIGLSLSAALLAQTYSVTTILPASAVKIDESKATAPLFGPSAVAVDSSGNVYFADTNSHRIKRIDAATLNITVVAGTGVSGSTGDNGPGTRALLNAPAGLAFDGAGNLYISDTGNHRIRVLSPSGTITLFAGTASGFSGDGGSAKLARLNSPRQVFIDGSGNVFIADTSNHRIRRVDRNGTISTVAGSGVSGYAGDGASATLARLNGPQGVAVDKDGNIYISDTANHSVRFVKVKQTDAAGKLVDIISTVIGAPVRNVVTDLVTRSTAVVDGTLGTNSGIDSPRGMAFDSNGRLYIASQGKDRIRVYTPSTGTVSGFHCGTSLTCGMDDPLSVAFDSAGNVWVAELANNRISKIEAGALVSYAGLPVGLLSPNARGVTTDPAGNVVVTDTGKHTIRRIAADGSVTTLAGIPGSSGFTGDTNNTLYTTTPRPVPSPSLAPTARLNNPWGGVFDPAGNFIFADRSNRRIRVVDPAGNIRSIAGSTVRVTRVNPDTLRPANADLTQGYNGDGTQATLGQLNNPDAVAIDNLGNIYVAEESNHVIRKIDPAGNLSTFAGVAPACANIPPLYTNSSDDPIGVGGVPNTGTGPSCSGVSSGVATPSGDGGPATAAPLNSPRGVAVDTKGNVYISETGTNSIRVVSVDGIINTVATGLQTPLGIAVDADGILFVASNAGNNIRRIDPATGVNTIIAGGGTDFGDGPDALKTRIQSPWAVGVDAAKNVYFTDQTARVRKLTPAPK